MFRIQFVIKIIEFDWIQSNIIINLLFITLI